MYRKNIVYIGFGTIQGFRHPLGVLQQIPQGEGRQMSTNGQKAHEKKLVAFQPQVDILRFNLGHPGLMQTPQGKGHDSHRTVLTSDVRSTLEVPGHPYF